MYYEIIAEQLWCEDAGYYNAYGVVVKDDRGNESLRISDVFTDKKIAEDFVCRCNRLGLDIIHIYDAIEDEIG
jgi:hypothetical protein